MTAVKKAYQPIVDLLEANPKAKVSDILAQVIELAQAKTSRVEGSAFKKDAQGNVVAIFDYYFKRWMPVVGEKAVEFGAKAKTATGLNTMCKEGVSHWTKQQRIAKQAQADLLTRVANGEVKPADIAKEQVAIEEARKAIVATELGFDNEADLMKYLAKSGIKMSAE